MQVPQVTEEIAMAVLDLFPTLFSLARAYSLLVSPHFFLLLGSQLFRNDNLIQTGLDGLPAKICIE